MTHSFSHVIGIDIAKDDFVTALYGSKPTNTFKNTPAGWKTFLKSLPHPNDTFVVLEVTGGYEMGLVEFLCKEGIALHRADTRKVKNFIRSLGTYTKTDPCDARNIARYGAERMASLSLFNPPSHTEKTLFALTQRRLELNQMLVQEKNRLQAPESKPLKVHLQKHIRYLEKEIKTITESCQALIRACDQMRKKQEILETVEGVGKLTSQALLSLLPELGHLNRKEIAALCGLAPYANDSGKHQGLRRIRGGRHNVRAALYMAAMAASRSKSRLGAFYHRLVQDNGKKPKVALTALMRKIIVIANAKIKENRI